MISRKKDGENLPHNTLIKLIDDETGEEIDSLLEETELETPQKGDTVSFHTGEYDADEERTEEENVTGKHKVKSREFEYYYVELEAENESLPDNADHLQTHIILNVESVNNSN